MTKHKKTSRERKTKSTTARNMTPYHPFLRIANNKITLPYAQLKDLVLFLNSNREETGLICNPRDDMPISKASRTPDASTDVKFQLNQFESALVRFHKSVATEFDVLDIKEFFDVHRHGTEHGQLRETIQIYLELVEARCNYKEVHKDYRQRVSEYIAKKYTEAHKEYKQRVSESQTTIERATLCYMCYNLSLDRKEVRCLGVQGDFARIEEFYKGFYEFDYDFERSVPVWEKKTVEFQHDSCGTADVFDSLEVKYFINLSLLFEFDHWLHEKGPKVFAITSFNGGHSVWYIRDCHPNSKWVQYFSARDIEMNLEFSEDLLMRLFFGIQWPWETEQFRRGKRKHAGASRDASAESPKRKKKSSEGQVELRKPSQITQIQEHITSIEEVVEVS